MLTPVKLPTLTAEEVTEIKRLASSRKEPIRLVQRARIIASMVEDQTWCATEAGLNAGFASAVIGVSRMLWSASVRLDHLGIAGGRRLGVETSSKLVS